MRISIRKLTIWLGASTFAIALMVIAYALIQATLAESQAKQLLSIISEFTVGKTNESDTVDRMQPFMTAANKHQDQETSVDNRVFSFDNIDMAKLRLSHLRRFTIVLRFQHHTLIEKSADFFVDHDCWIHVAERTRDVPMPGESPDPNYRNHFSTIPSGYPHPVNQVTIIDDDTYPKPLRDEDWKFNLANLTHFGGCSDARAILPAISR